MRRRCSAWVAATVAGLLLAGCGAAGGADGGSVADDQSAPPASEQSAPPASEQSAPPASEPAAPVDGFPVTVEDCEGPGDVFDAPPERIVTANWSTLELLFWLGVEDRVVGTGFPPRPGVFPEQFADGLEDVPVLSDSVIAKEALLGARPELQVQVFPATGMMAEGATPEELAEAGIGTYLLRATGCGESLPQPQTDLSLVEQDILDLGAVVGEPARAQELVDDMRATTSRVEEALADLPQEERPTVFSYSDFTGAEAPTVQCGRQVANGVITAAGGRNLFADCPGATQEVSWEEVVRRDPDWIQLAILARGDDAANEEGFAEAERFLREGPTADLDAVREGRFIRIPLELTTIGGVRSAETVEQMAAVLHPDRVQP